MRFLGKFMNEKIVDKTLNLQFIFFSIISSKVGLISDLIFQ